MRILVYLDVQQGAVTGLSREVAGAARQLAGAGGQVDLALFGADPAAACGLGADRVLTAPGAAAGYNPAAHAGWLARAIETAAPDLVLLGNSTSALDLAPAAALASGRPLLCYCTRLAVEGGEIAAASQIYGGKLIAETRAALPAIAVVSAGAFEEPAPGEDRPEIVELAGGDGAGAAGEGGIRILSTSAPDPDAVDITRAERLLCVGRGIGDEDAIEEAREAAALLGGELVGSRPIVDAGWLPKERQVGKSGRKVKPQLYLALGVSGAPEHIEGMGASGLIVAINTDAGAPIFDHAHLGATVDLADFLPAFKDALAAKAG